MSLPPRSVLQAGNALLYSEFARRPDDNAPLNWPVREANARVKGADDVYGGRPGPSAVIPEEVRRPQQALQEDQDDMPLRHPGQQRSRTSSLGSWGAIDEGMVREALRDMGFDDRCVLGESCSISDGPFSSSRSQSHPPHPQPPHHHSHDPPYSSSDAVVTARETDDGPSVARAAVQQHNMRAEHEEPRVRKEGMDPSDSSIIEAEARLRRHYPDEDEESLQGKHAAFAPRAFSTGESSLLHLPNAATTRAEPLRMDQQQQQHQQQPSYVDTTADSSRREWPEEEEGGVIGLLEYRERLQRIHEVLLGWERAVEAHTDTDAHQRPHSLQAAARVLHPRDTSPRAAHVPPQGPFFANTGRTADGTKPIHSIQHGVRSRPTAQHANPTTMSRGHSTTQKGMIAGVAAVGTGSSRPGGKSFATLRRTSPGARTTTTRVTGPTGSSCPTHGGENGIHAQDPQPHPPHPSRMEKPPYDAYYEEEEVTEERMRLGESAEEVDEGIPYLHQGGGRDGVAPRAVVEVRYPRYHHRGGGGGSTSSTEPSWKEPTSERRVPGTCGGVPTGCPPPGNPYGCRCLSARVGRSTTRIQDRWRESRVQATAAAQGQVHSPRLGPRVELRRELGTSKRVGTSRSTPSTLPASRHTDRVMLAEYYRNLWERRDRRMERNGRNAVWKTRCALQLAYLKDHAITAACY